MRAAIQSAEQAGNYVVLLGSECNKDFCSNWYDAEKFTGTGYEGFADLYVHMSSNPYKFEILCFRRYFFLYKYMTMNNIDCAVMLDSDVLCYVCCSSEKFIEAVKDKSVSVSSFRENGGWSGRACGPQFLFIRREALKGFIDFCIDTYKNHLDDLKEDYHKRFELTGNPGGICDMTLLAMYADTLTPSEVLNWTEQEGFMIDHNVNISRGEKLGQYRMDKLLGIKAMRMKDNVPYFYDMDKSKWVQVDAVHFQGGAKKYMRDVFYGRPYIVKVLRSLYWKIRSMIPSSVKKPLKKILRRK